MCISWGLMRIIGPSTRVISASQICYVPEPYHAIRVPPNPPGRTAGVPSALIEDTYLVQTTDESIATSYRRDTIRSWFERDYESHISRAICISYGRESYQRGGSHLA